MSLRIVSIPLAFVLLACATPSTPASIAPSVSTPATSLYMPRAVKRAFANGTHLTDGRPGANYWENHARYAIAVTVALPNRAVQGTEEITYMNQSPDTLSRLVMKVLLNIHKPGAPRDGGASDDYLTSGVHIDRLVVNGRPSPPRPEGSYFTSMPVTLASKLLPHDSVHLSISWHFDLSREAGREGMIDSTTAYLAYFYPRVAVYDDYNGWDTMDFTDNQEFYSDFNDYDVTVRAPANYVVWGTGTLTNPSAVLQPQYAKRLETSMTSDQTIRIATRSELAAHGVTAAGPVNEWHFTATNISDMAFGVSDHYDWDGASVVVDSAAHRRASVQAAYNDSAPDFHRIVQLSRASLAWLSSNWPGVPYPYEKTTIFQGGAGMEYPMMVNDESYGADTTFAKFVAAHELAHTYFPFYMGINETRYGFMDEGWATTFEYLLNRVDMGPDRAVKFFQDFRVNGWAHDPSPLEDLPIITPEDMLKGSAYGNNAYGKPSLGYLAAKDLLGDADFKRCLHAFIDRWHGKHTIPWDFFNTFNNVSGRDLNWFWNNWFFSNNYIDFGVRAVNTTSDGFAVVIDNIGGLVAPVDVEITYADGSHDVLHQTPALWMTNQRSATVSVATNKTVQSVRLNGGIFVDADMSNNSWTKR